MDHSEATAAHAVERYLLHEMTEAEVEGFEEHFFECAICTEELASGAMLAQTLRAVPQPIRATSHAWWRQPAFAAPAFAALALAVIVGYQARELARVNQPRQLSPYALASVRGNTHAVPANQPFTQLSFDLPDTSYPEYRFDLYDASDRLRFSVPGRAPQPAMPFSISVPRGLPAGSYFLKVWGIRGDKTEKIEEYRFEAVKQ